MGSRPILSNKLVLAGLLVAALALAPTGQTFSTSIDNEGPPVLPSSTQTAVSSSDPIVLDSPDLASVQGQANWGGDDLLVGSSADLPLLGSYSLYSVPADEVRQLPSAGIIEAGSIDIEGILIVPPQGTLVLRAVEEVTIAGEVRVAQPTGPAPHIMRSVEKGMGEVRDLVFTGSNGIEGTAIQIEVQSPTGAIKLQEGGRIQTGSGTDGVPVSVEARPPSSHSLHVLGGDGGNGGNLTLVAPEVRLLGEVQLGNGGNGGSAFADASKTAMIPGSFTEASGGSGGAAGTILAPADTVLGPNLELTGAFGGNGGNATSIGATGTEGNPRPTGSFAAQAPLAEGCASPGLSDAGVGLPGAPGLPPFVLGEEWGDGENGENDDHTGETGSKGLDGTEGTTGSPGTKGCEGGPGGHSEATGGPGGAGCWPGGGGYGNSVGGLGGKGGKGGKGGDGADATVPASHGSPGGRGGEGGIGGVGGTASAQGGRGGDVWLRGEFGSTYACAETGGTGGDATGWAGGRGQGGDAGNGGDGGDSCYPDITGSPATGGGSGEQGQPGQEGFVAAAQPGLGGDPDGDDGKGYRKPPQDNPSWGSSGESGDHGSYKSCLLSDEVEDLTKNCQPDKTEGESCVPTCEEIKDGAPVSVADPCTPPCEGKGIVECLPPVPTCEELREKYLRNVDASVLDPCDPPCTSGDTRACIPPIPTCNELKATVGYPDLFIDPCEPPCESDGAKNCIPPIPGCNDLPVVLPGSPVDGIDPCEPGCGTWESCLPAEGCDGPDSNQCLSLTTMTLSEEGNGLEEETYYLVQEALETQVWRETNGVEGLQDDVRKGAVDLDDRVA